MRNEVESMEIGGACMNRTQGLTIAGGAIEARLCSKYCLRQTQRPTALRRNQTCKNIMRPEDRGHRSGMQYFHSIISELASCTQKKRKNI